MGMYTVTISVDEESLTNIAQRANDFIEDLMGDFDIPICHELRMVIAERILKQIKSENP